MSTNKKAGNLRNLALGLAVGFGLGLLLAPKKGSETRKDLKIKFNNLKEKVKNIDMDDVRDNIYKKMEDIKEELKDLDQEKVLDIAKKKASDIKDMCSNLVDYTKEKTSPMVSKAADSLRNKAIDVTKDVLDKLENNK